MTRWRSFWICGLFGIATGVALTSLLVMPRVSADADAPRDASRHVVDAPPAADPLDDLRARHLQMPVRGVSPHDLRRSFHDRRDGEREHEALDILAPRGTPVLAVEDGRIVKLFLSKAGGNTIYQFDPSERFAYYYAHLDRYAADLRENHIASRGQVIGYVGTTGNAPPQTPHLHFAIFLLTPAKQWWHGSPIDPYDVWR